jgi:uncharacterized protein (TIGR03435 family)
MLRNERILTFSTATLSLLVIGYASGQPTPKFEVASVKANKSGNQLQGIAVPGGGRFTATNVPLRSLITAAYRLQDYQLLDLPAWASSERYDIAAKTEENIGGASIWPLVRTLLEDRFQLNSHTETRDFPLYALVVSKPGRLAESERSCAPPPPGPPSPPEAGKLACGGMFMFPNGANGIRINGAKAPIEPLLGLLSRLTGRPVLNKTGLAGKYDIDLQFAADPNQSVAAQEAPPADANGSSLFTALQDQLGLKLESQKGPVEVLIVDHVERPSEN